MNLDTGSVPPETLVAASVLAVSDIGSAEGFGYTIVLNSVYDSGFPATFSTLIVIGPALANWYL
jgi:hypothetical protein